MLDREEAIRSQKPDGVEQELWGILLAYNLVRLEMASIAREESIKPTRISFVESLRLMRRVGMAQRGEPGRHPQASCSTAPQREEIHPARAPKTQLSAPHQAQDQSPQLEKTGRKTLSERQVRIRTLLRRERCRSPIQHAAEEPNERGIEFEFERSFRAAIATPARANKSSSNSNSIARRVRMRLSACAEERKIAGARSERSFAREATLVRANRVRIRTLVCAAKVSLSGDPACSGRAKRAGEFEFEFELSFARRRYR